MGDGPGVEQHRRGRIPRLLLTADHQLVAPGGGPPVDATDVVAGSVVAGNPARALDAMGEGAR